MAGLTLTMKHDDIARRGVAQYVREIKARGKDLRPAWDDVLGVIHRHEMMLFENEGRSSENPGGWDDLSNNPHPARGNLGYRDWKALHYPGAKILELTGRLKAQLTGFDNTAFVKRGVRRLTFGSNIRVAGGHDLGGLHADGRPGAGVGGNYMPPRPPIIVSTGEIDEIAEAVLDYLLEGPVPNLPPIARPAYRRRVLSSAHRRKLSLLGKARWANMTPQQRQARTAGLRRGRR